LITVAGFNFSGTSAVSFGATPANTFTVINDSVLTATVSNGASGYLKVTNAFDSDSLDGFNFSPPPSISSFTPSSGSVGNPVYITGNGFTGATQVFFGNVAANYFSIDSDSQITAYPGSGASGYIKVISLGGRDSSAGFTFIYPPVINSFSPTGAFAGTTVSIHGNHFNTTSAVSFGSNPADSFIIVSDTLIHAVVASGNSGNITVINIAGSANASGFVYLSPPVISSFTPADAPAGNTVTIYGSYFTNITAVSFGDVPAASFAGISDNEIKAVTGSGSSGSIIVATPLGSDTISGFTFIQPPHISSFAPLSGGSGDTITITGNNLLNTSAVKLGGVAAASFTVLSATVIKAVIGSGASGPIKITTPGGTDSLAGFSYIPPPSINAFLPVAAASGSLITIKGTNLTGTTIVTLGGIAAASFSIINDSSITAIVGNGSSGSISITNKYGNSSLAGFTYLPPPLFSSFNPTTAATGNPVTITGNHFSNATAISFGGVSATSFTVISPTSISAVVGNGASGNISVTTPYGVGTKTGFTYLPPPSITSFTPQSGSFGTTITITGSNFANPVTVTIGDIPVAATVVNSNTIQATVGPVASGNIVVASNNGMASMGGFTYLPYRKYVTQTGAGLKTGNSWADAWSDSLFAANIYNQAAGTEIWIAKGTYKPNRNENGTVAADPSLTFSVPNGVKLYGGFADRIPMLIHTTNKTKLSADIGTIGFQGDNPGFAVKLTNCTNSETLDGLTISDATQTGTSIHITTGMIAPPMVNNCIIQDNYPNGSTGGIEINGSSASSFTTTNSSFRNNRGYSGGAIKGIGCTLRVSNSVFYENANQTNLFSASNSIYFSNASGSVTNCTFFGNRSNTTSTVIGLQNIQDSVFINNSIFWKNYDFSSVATNNINVISGSNMATVKNCLFQNQTLGTAPAVLLNSFNQDPFFEGETNPTGADGLMNTADDGLRLTTCSPAINKGNNSFVVGLTKDILDNPRIFGSLVDLGAYEVQQSATTGISVQSQPVNLTVNTGDTVQLSAAATGGSIGYQWQTFNGSNWINLVSDTVYNNVQSPLLLINNVPFALNGKKYRCLFSNQFCSGYQSNEAVLTVRQQEIVTLCPGGGTTILGTIQGNPTVITTEWQVDTGTGYRPIVNNANYSGTATSALQLINIPSTWYGYKYRYVVNGSIYSQVFQLKFASRWTGSANNSWENPANWSCGQVPDSNTDLTIDVTTNGGVPSPSNVIVGANSICRSLTVLPGGNTVTVLPGFTLTVVR
jgi:IPT/TIG domain